MHPANERRRYNVTPSLIAWAHAQNDPCRWCLGDTSPTAVLTMHDKWVFFFHALQWRHNGRDGISNHQPNDCLLNRLFRHRSKKTSKLRVTGLCVGNSPVTGEFPAQRTSNAANVSIWWRHHGKSISTTFAIPGQTDNRAYRYIFISLQNG